VSGLGEFLDEFEFSLTSRGIMMFLWLWPAGFSRREGRRDASGNMLVGERDGGRESRLNL
jgi:hypothetical protein